MRTTPELGALITLLADVAELPGPRLAIDRSTPTWERWFELVEEHQLGALVAARTVLPPNVGRLGASVPDEIITLLEGRYARAGHEAAFKTIELFRILNALEPPLTPVVLKGAALARTLYADAVEREMSDIDILLGGRDQLKIASATLAGLGYEAKLDDEDTLETERAHHHAAPLVSSVAELAIELHTNLTTPPLPERAIVEMLHSRVRLAIPGCRNLAVLDPVWAVIHHALHALADPIDSPLLRNLFELAWMVERLSTGERSALRERAGRWRIEGRIASALHVASELFGSAPVFEEHSPGARELWCLARLEWTRSFAGVSNWWSRFRRHLAREHVGAVDRGADDRSPLPLVAAVAGGVVSAAKARFESKATHRTEEVEQVRVPNALVVGCLLAHDPGTGAVHTLDRVSTRVWSAAGVHGSIDHLERVLAAEGIGPEATRAALASLLDKGLLRNARPRR